jgi:hypothetical protein
MMDQHVVGPKCNFGVVALFECCVSSSRCESSRVILLLVEHVNYGTHVASPCWRHWLEFSRTSIPVKTHDWTSLSCSFSSWRCRNWSISPMTLVLLSLVVDASNCCGLLWIVFFLYCNNLDMCILEMFWQYLNIMLLHR